MSANAAPTQTPAAAPDPTSQISQARLEANRQNAQHSTGATSPEGKARVRYNAIKNNLTGQHLIIREEDGPLYKKLVTDFHTQLEPVGPQESALVQSLVDINWRLNRIPGLEMALLSKGQDEIVAEKPGAVAPEHASRLELEARLRYQKEFRNLALQESRLTRRRERETAELSRLQTERKSHEPEALTAAAKAQLLARHHNQPAPSPAGLGFVFSKQRFDTFMSNLNSSARQILLEMAINEAANHAQNAAEDAAESQITETEAAA